MWARIFVVSAIAEKKKMEFEPTIPWRIIGELSDAKLKYIIIRMVNWNCMLKLHAWAYRPFSS